MKRILGLFICMAFILVVAGSLWAGPPEKVVLNAKPGNITFPHQKHAETLKIECKTCHHTLKEGETPVKCTTCHGVDPKAPKPQDAFHKRCQGCHKEQNEKNGKNAPTKCTQCHVKA